jgi:hypothetical protein
MGHALRAQAVEPSADTKGRRKVLLSGLVQSGPDHFPVRVREIWRDGAAVQAEVIPEIGSLVLLTRGMLIVAAQVVDADEAGFELAFREAIDEQALMGTGTRGTSAPQRWVLPVDPFLDDDEDDDRLPVSKH